MPDIHTSDGLKHAAYIFADRIMVPTGASGIAHNVALSEIALNLMRAADVAQQMEIRELRETGQLGPRA